MLSPPSPRILWSLLIMNEKRSNRKNLSLPDDRKSLQIVHDAWGVDDNYFRMMGIDFVQGSFLYRAIGETVVDAEFRFLHIVFEKTKAIISVDIGGIPCDYDNIKNILENKKHLFKPSKNKYQKELKRILFLSDAAHSIGAIYKDKRVGSQADFTSFSFHAVKNITTAEGGSLAFNDIGNIKADEIYKEISIWALNGQNKSALDKEKGGKNSWKYNI